MNITTDLINTKMKTKQGGSPNTNTNTEANNCKPLETEEKKQFTSVGKQYRKIAGVRYRLPRKVKKMFKTRFCKMGWDVKKLRFSYRRLNQDVKRHGKGKRQ